MRGNNKPDHRLPQILFSEAFPEAKNWDPFLTLNCLDLHFAIYFEFYKSLYTTWDLCNRFHFLAGQKVSNNRLSVRLFAGTHVGVLTFTLSLTSYLSWHWGVWDYQSILFRENVWFDEQHVDGRVVGWWPVDGWVVVGWHVVGWAVDWWTIVAWAVYGRAVVRWVVDG